MQSFKLEKYNDKIFIIMGMLVFSPISSFLSLKSLHLPMALPELFFLPFCFILRKKFKSVQLKTSEIIKALFLLVMLFIFALLSASFSLYAILSNARAWLYLFLFFCIFRYDNNITYNDLFYLAFGSILGWAFMCIVNMNSFMLIGDYYIRVTYGLMMSLPLFYSIGIYNNKHKLLLVGFSLTIVIIMFCGTRRVILVTALSLVVSLLILGIYKKKNLFSYIVIGVVLFLCFKVFLPTIRESINEFSPHLHYRLFTRTEALIKEGAEASEDTGRFNLILSIGKDMEETFIPQGFISMQTDGDDGTGRYNDFPLVMLFWIFGWPFSFIILFYLITITFKNIRKSFRIRDLSSFVAVVCIMTIILLLFIDGSFITYAYATPITGAILGLAVKTTKRKKYLLKQ